MLARLLFLSGFVLACRCIQRYASCSHFWKDETIGRSNITVCQGGSLLVSLSVLLSDKFTPSTLNEWLKKNEGYTIDNQVRWNSLSKVGAMYSGNLTSFKQVFEYLHNLSEKPDQPHPSCLLQCDGHWVFAYNKDEGGVIFVSDPTGWCFNVASTNQATEAICFREYPFVD
jgi:hypothetical protein